MIKRIASKGLIASGLAVAATLIACGGGGPPMTIEEYAAACEELSDRFDEDSSSPFDSMEDVLTELKRWNPPEELQEFHETRIRVGEATVDALKETGFLGLVQDLEKAIEEEDQVQVLRLQSEMADMEEKMSELEDELEALEDEGERVIGALPPTTRRILEAADCL